MSRPLPLSLSDWLAYIERVHPRAVEMGLDRVEAVRRSMALAPAFPVITVGGTNGKGSACAMLEAILHEAGYKVACYTSPHLLRYNERIRISREDARDAEIVEALQEVDQARAGTPLTYFEFSTLAAMWLFVRRGVDCAVLEVGLGGRLDAVNVFDADCAMIMSIALDHVDYLGGTREAIAVEKAGILRAGRPAVCAEPDPPAALLERAAQIGSRLQVLGEDFGFVAEGRQWRYWGPGGERYGLPYPALRGSYQLANAAGCIAALDALRERLPVAANDVRTGLLVMENPGRFQVLPGRPTVILDVAHNPHAALALARTLRELPAGGRTYAVFAMLKDKDIDGVIDAVKSSIDAWFIAGIAEPRGADVALLKEKLLARGAGSAVTTCESVAQAYVQACEMATEADKIIVFGSFYTVAGAMAARGGHDST